VDPEPVCPTIRVSRLTLNGPHSCALKRIYALPHLVDMTRARRSLAHQGASGSVSHSSITRSFQMFRRHTFRLIASSAVIRPSRPRSASSGPSRCLVPSPPELQRSIRAVEVQQGADGRLYPVQAATSDERRRVRARAHALVLPRRGTGSPGRGVVPGSVFFRRKDQPCSALTCWKNTLNDVPMLLSAVGNACSVPAPVPVLVAFSGLVVKNDDSVCFFPL
jgi:hypothetical protein